MARALIGPKKQAAVPEHIGKWIEGESERRGIREAEVVRELVCAGFEKIQGLRG